MANKTVLIMAGGTGGHVFPGLALAEEMQSRGYVVEWLGTNLGIEARLVPAAKIALHVIPVKGVRGKTLREKLLAPLNILSSVTKALRIIRHVKPSVVVGLGGFVAGPGGLGARLLGLPLVIHEQNAVVGTTNKLLAKIASKVLSGFPINLTKSEVIGNPVRKEFESIPAPASRIDSESEKTKVLILGGSRGAQALNEMMPQAFSKMKNNASVELWHQAGGGKDEATRKLYSTTGLSVKVDAFIDDIPMAYRWADIVICRAGALTVSEIAAVGIASLLIPFPYAIDDHQTENAKFLESHGAAIVRQQSELDPDSLASVLNSIVFDKSKLLDMANRARALAKVNTVKIFADRCEECAYA